MSFFCSFAARRSSSSNIKKGNGKIRKRITLYIPSRLTTYTVPSYRLERIKLINC